MYICGGRRDSPWRMPHAFLDSSLGDERVAYACDAITLAIAQRINFLINSFTLSHFEFLTSLHCLGHEHLFMDIDRQWTLADVPHHVQVDRTQHDGHLWRQ